MTHFEKDIVCPKDSEMNHTVKRMTSRIRQEANWTWNKVFHTTLYQVRVAPRNRIQLQPY